MSDINIIETFKNNGFLIFFRCYEDDPDANAEMQLEQALDENDVVYHDTMIAANSWNTFNPRKSLLEL